MSRISKDIKVKHLENVHLLIKLLGYSQEGESILIELVDEEQTHFQCLTDCYSINDKNYWIENNYSPSKLDAFIWTHPDEDHSIGIVQTLKILDPTHRAQIYLPSSLNTAFLEREMRHTAKEALSYIHRNYNTERRYNVNEVSLTEGETRQLISFRIHERSTNTIINGGISFLLPNTAVVSRRTNSDVLSAGEMNDFSIVYLLSLNRQNFFFTADLRKQNIQFLNRNQLTDCRFLKIPHHGSKDVTSICGKITPFYNDGVVSATTIYGTKMPYAEALSQYARISSHLFSTDRGDYSYGIVSLDFPIAQDGFSCSCKGNAKRLK